MNTNDWALKDQVVGAYVHSVTATDSEPGGRTDRWTNGRTDADNSALSFAPIYRRVVNIMAARQAHGKPAFLWLFRSERF